MRVNELLSVIDKNTKVHLTDNVKILDNYHKGMKKVKHGNSVIKTMYANGSDIFIEIA